MSKHFKEASIIAYKTLDGVCRIQYKDYVIQTYGYDDGTPDINLMHFIICPDGHDVGEKNCLIDCLNHIDKISA